MPIIKINYKKYTMINEFYDYLDSEDKSQFFFVSEGKQGEIIKMVLFTHLRDDLWNLGFGDLHKGQIDDSIISNNHDIVKLIGTIAKIVYDFSEAFPLRRIEINPIDEKRKRLYHHVFRRNFDIINADFQVKGVYKGIDEEEDYSPEKIYDFFRLKRKFVQ